MFIDKEGLDGKSVPANITIVAKTSRTPGTYLYFKISSLIIVLSFK